jgi:hypothetical protein
MPDKLYYDVFAVGEKLYCLWDRNLNRLNREFLNKVDCQYFAYLADVHSHQLTGPHKFRAAVELHTAYYHGLETLFSLIFAALQSPGAIPAWIMKCRTDDLRNLVRSMNDGRALTRASLKFETYSWQAISDLINGVALQHRKDNEQVAAEFAKAWTLFGKDFVDEFQIDAYNSFKHGFRVNSGGIKIEFMPGEESATANSARKSVELGESKFGVSFPRLAAFKGTSSHVRLIKCHVNCHPHYMAQALPLVSMSIHNTVSFLNLFNGFPREDGICPDGDNWFERLNTREGLTNLVSDENIREEDIEVFNKEELELLFQKNGGLITIYKDNEAKKTI